MLPWSVSTGLGLQQAGGSDAPVPEAVPKTALCVGVWDHVDSHTPGLWLLALVLCLCPTLVTGQPHSLLGSCPAVHFPREHLQH